VRLIFRNKAILPLQKVKGQGLILFFLLSDDDIFWRLQAAFVTFEVPSSLLPVIVIPDTRAKSVIFANFF
jgi:hypothetical protein